MKVFLKRNSFFIMVISMTLLILSACNGNEDAAEVSEEEEGVEVAASEDAEVNMVAATINPSDHILTETLIAFAEEIENQSGGEISFTVHSGGTVGNASSIYQSVISGDLDMIYTDTGWFVEHNPEFELLGTTYLYRDQEHFESIINSEEGLDYFEELLIESPGLKTVMYAGGNERNIISTFPVEDISDLSGRQMRSGGSSTEMEWWSMLGANPINVDLSEVYSGLQTGVVEGSQNSVNAMLAERFGEVATHLNRTAHIFDLGFVVMNNDKYEELSDEHKESIDDAASIVQEEYISKAFNDTEDLVEELVEEFDVTVVEPELNEFIEVAEEHRNRVIDENDIDPEVLEQFE